MKSNGGWLSTELGQKVKVTLLATGFGIEDVDGMDSHLKKHTQEEADRMAQEEERRAERDERRGHYYGNIGKNNQYKRRPRIFLFRPEDLDNEDVILAVESTPTYKRTSQMLEEIRNQAAGNQVAKNDEKSGGEPTQTVISFT